MKYYQPTSLDQYFELQSSLDGMDVTMLAGGTDLMPRYERGISLPDHLVDLKNIPELSSLIVHDDRVEIGALTSIQRIHDHALIQEEFVALFQAAHDFAGAQIRHRGTMGGNICNASPAGDLLPALYAFGAELTLQGPRGIRQLPINEFILGPGQNALQEAEILISISLERKHLQSQFQKVGLRQSMAISVVNVAFVFEENGKDLTITAGAVAPTVVSLDKFTAAYLKKPDDLPNLLAFIDDAISPIDDIRASANYRRTVLKNLIEDFLKR